MRADDLPDPRDRAAAKRAEESKTFFTSNLLLEHVWHFAHPGKMPDLNFYDGYNETRMVKE